jgi:hypothetical protein
MGAVPKQYTDAGHILLAVKPDHTSNSIIIIFSLSIALCLFLCMLIPDLIRLKENKPRRKKVQSQWRAFKHSDTSSNRNQHWL